MDTKKTQTQAQENERGSLDQHNKHSMVKRKVRKEDGRLLIFYSFGNSGVKQEDESNNV